MAYNIRNINVLDLRKSTGIGVSLPFNNPAVFQTVYTTKDQIKYNLINFLLTDPRERIFNPTFGAGIRGKLFEQITDSTADDLDLLIRSGVERYFPNVVITQLVFGGNPNDNILTVNFSYTIKNTRESDNITLSIDG
jgi:phage baseplate assembly protein W